MDATTHDDRLASPEPARLPAEAAAPLAPVRESERLEVLDALRGLCILGILAVNIFAYGLPGMAFMVRGTWEGQSLLDDVAHGAVSVIFTQKFYPILSLLFGVGMWMQLSKGRKGQSRLPQYLWRTFLLAVLGAIHGILFFYGDVLFTYACCATLACLLWRTSARLKMILGVLLVALVSLLCMPAMFGMAALSESMQPAAAGEGSMQFPIGLGVANAFAAPRSLDANMLTYITEMRQPRSDAVIAHYFAEGTFLEATAIRTAQWLMFIVGSAFSFAFQITGLMLVGMATAQAGLWRDPRSRRKALLWGAGIGWTVGLPVAVIGTALGSVDASMVGMALLSPAAPFQATAYVCTFLLLWEASWFRALCTGFKAVGRTALTNYLGQSVVFTTLFMGYGFGLFGRLSYAELVALAAASWIMQMAASWLWLRAFQMGPVEWLWRSAAYGKMQRLRRAA